MSATVQFVFHTMPSKKLQKIVSQYQMQVGVLPEDAPRAHYPAVELNLWGIEGKKANGKVVSNPFKSFPAGGTARRIDQSAEPDGTIGEIFAKAQAATGINLLSEPLNRGESKDLMKLLGEFFRIIGDSKKPVKRLRNAVQALIRNPITRGDYGKNRKGTSEVKGFDTMFVDTGQLFNAIKAKVGRGV